MKNIFYYFKKTASQYPDNICLIFKDQEYRYRQVYSDAVTIAGLIDSFQHNTRVGVIGHRSYGAYVGVLAALGAGRTYVPFGPKLPLEKLHKIRDISGVSLFICDYESLWIVEQLLAVGSMDESLVIVPDCHDVDLPDSMKNYCVKTRTTIEQMNCGDFNFTPHNDHAYIMYTSGTTGKPKGVPITHENLCAYIDYTLSRYNVTCHDRFSQTFDLTFDLSVHDMWVCWSAGATLCIPDRQLLNPLKYINQYEITFWFAVPSLVQHMSKFHQLSPSSYPLLRYVLFCGEALPIKLASEFQAAAPNSIVENLYGPTEATIAISNYRWNQSQENSAMNGILSIGRIFEGQHYLLIDEQANLVASGVPGELCLGGAQIIESYLQSDVDTSNRFLIKSVNGCHRWYRTGDLVVEDAQKNLFFLSRLDFQVKVNGYRIELEEINNALSEIIGCGRVCSVHYSSESFDKAGIYTFAEGHCQRNKKELLTDSAKVLPEYMIPKDVFFVEAFPLNANGKIDRGALNELLQQKFDDL